MKKKRQYVLRSEVIKEIVACGDDPIYFIEKYCMVRHPKHGLVPFKLYNYQKDAIRNFINNRNTIVNKARQLGFTTLTAAFIAWLILFHKDKQVLVVSTKAEIAKEMTDRIKVMLNHLPDWLYLADFVENRAHKISLTNGSSVESVARSDDAGRSKSLALLVIDEAAHIRNMDEMWKGLKSTVATGGKTIALSTPKGIGNWFYKIYSDAVAGANDWYPMLVNWWECPEYAYDLEDDPETPGGKTSTWFREFTKDMSPSQVRQELLTEFLETGDTFFTSQTIKMLAEKAKHPISRTGRDNAVWTWVEPVLGHKYLLSTDTASGAGEDYSAYHVIDLNTMEVVCEYMGKIQPDLFGDMCIEAAEKYNMAYIAADNQGSFAHAACYHIKNAGYKNMMFFNKDFKMVDRWVAEYERLAPGIPTDVRNRGAMVAKLEEYLRKGLITTYSHRLVNELYTFAIINGKPQAIKSPGCHDDLIMALALGVWIREIVPELSVNFNPMDAAAAIKSIQVSRQQYNHEKMTIAQRQAELRKKIEEKGFTIAQPFVPYIFFSK